METSSLFDVHGKIVLVTGGAKGIGRMISEGFVVNGAKVYIAGRKARDGEIAVKELNDRGKGKAIFIQADLYSEADVRRLSAEIYNREQRLHILVNNAGSVWGAPYAEFPDSAWTRVLTLNLQRVFLLTQLLTPLLERAATTTDPARIIHIGSIDALRTPVAENFSYSAAKAGLHHLSRVLAGHLGKRNITRDVWTNEDPSNTLACGPFHTSMTKSSFNPDGEGVKESVPLGRIGRPEDVAGSCLFLSSKAGAFVNGATITLDGGYIVGARL